jgi:hypothetical protein
MQLFNEFHESRRREELMTSGHTFSRNGYIVRVELHQIENSKDYKELRQYMLDAGFYGVVVNDNGVRFKLPTATYYHPYPGHMQFTTAIHEKAAHAVQKALDGAYARVRAANRIPTVFVTSADGLYWTGLALAEEDDE